jgi:type I restriction enzyme, S subunit
VTAVDEESLPESWELAQIRDLVEINYGKGLREDNRKNGPIPVYGSNGVVGTHNVSLTNGPTIVLGRKGSIGEIHLCSSGCWPIDTTYYIDNFRDLDPTFLVAALRNLNLAELDTSTAIPGLNRDDIYDQQILLPPLAEQKRLASRLGYCADLVKSTHDHLSRVAATLKRLRQAVLVAACSGRLTEDWRAYRESTKSSAEFLRTILAMRADRVKEQGVGAIRKPTDPDGSQLSDVPEEWAIASIDQVSCMVTSGSRGWAKYYAESGPLFIRAQDINTDRLQTDGIAHVAPPDNAEGKRTRVRFGDLLVTITGANVTKAALLDREIGESYVSQHVALVRPVDPSIGQFLYLWVVSPRHGRAKLLDDAYGAGKPGLNLDNIKETSLALPSLEEQQEIVRRVDALFKLADTIEVRVATATERAHKLTESILAKAFRGELVPTEAELARRECREYESASALLERIRAERENQVKSPQVSKHKSKKSTTLVGA